MNISYEKMLFYNDLLEYRVSKQGKKVNDMFNCLERYNDIDMQELENAINEYYVARNNDTLKYDSDTELEYAKEQDRYIARLYKEQN